MNKIGKLLHVTRSNQVHNVRYASWIKSLFKVDKIQPPYGHCVQVRNK